MFALLKKVFKSEWFARRFFLIRLKYLVFKNKVRTGESEHAFSVTVSHNIKSLKKSLNRMNLLAKPLSVLENVRKNSKILVIGPRNEWDFFLLWLAGFSFKNCVGLDLISYSPKIVLGDMHKMPFEDGSFDVVLCGWTLSYSANPKLVASEIERVCVKKGIIGVGVEYAHPIREKIDLADIGYEIQEKDRLRDRINSTKMILDLFDCEKELFFNHDAPMKNHEIIGGAYRPEGYNINNCVVIFEVK